MTCRLALGFSAWLMLAACSGDASQGEPPPRQPVPEDPAVVVLEVSPQDETLLVGETVAFRATVDGQDAAVEWSTSNDVGAIDASGTFTARFSGQTRVMATAGDTTASAHVSVEHSRATQLVVTPAELDLVVPSQATVTAAVLDQRDHPYEHPVTWAVLDPTIASVDDGVVTAKSAGLTTVTARAGDAVAELPLRVRAITSLRIVPGGGDVFMNEPQQLTLEYLDEAGEPIEADRQAQWSTAPGASHVTEAGVLHAVASIEDETVTVRAEIADPRNPEEGQLEVSEVFDIQVRLRELWCRGTMCCGVDSAHSAYCWGVNWFGYLGYLERESIRPIPVQGVPPLRSALPGRYWTCGLDLDDQAWCWGANQTGQLGRGFASTSEGAGPVVGDHKFSELALGFDAACGLDFGGHIYCWGVYPVAWSMQTRPTPGVTLEHRLTPYKLNDAVWKQIRMEQGKLCALAQDDTWWCQGMNNHGETSTQPGNELVPALQPLTHTPRFVDIDNTLSSSCALDGVGQVWCWGSGPAVGRGPNEDVSRVPMRTNWSDRFDRFIHVPHSSMNYAACAWRADELYCWGQNFSCMMGRSTSELDWTEHPVLIDVPAMLPTKSSDTIRQLSMSTWFGCALLESGQLWCWGTLTEGNYFDNEPGPCNPDAIWISGPSPDAP